MDGVGGQSAGRQALRSSGEILGLSHGQAGAGLVGTCAVLRDALVNGLVLRSDASQSQSAARSKQRSSVGAEFLSRTEDLHMRPRRPCNIFFL